MPGKPGLAGIGSAPAAIQALPSTARAVYLQAFTSALHPVFLYAAAIAAAAFALTWFLRELPLRSNAPSPATASVQE